MVVASFDKSTMSSSGSNSSPFLTLPVELRLQIYELVLLQKYPTSTLELSFDEKSHTLIRNPRPSNLNLTSLTHQIRSESLPLLTSLTTLVLHTSVLGQSIQLLAGKPHNPADLSCPLRILRTWLSWSAGHRMNVIIDLGVWYTWWERATADIVAESAVKFADAVGQGRAKVTLYAKVEWFAIPMLKEDFELRVPLWDLEGGRRRVQGWIAEKEGWTEAQTARCWLRENLETCRSKIERLFDLLEGKSDGEGV